jgi:DNA (cytosine-5)-methyltransferase 1
MIAGSMCTGYGGLDLAVEDVLGASLAWVADLDPGAARILEHRYPGLPNYGDIRAADWAAAEPVDVLAFGFPCQPVSAAGQRRGVDDERWLIDDILAAIGRMVALPRLLVLENVSGLLSANRGHAMARVIHGLAALGYVGSWRLVRASDAGAPHQRPRVFILAWLASDADGAARDQRRVTGSGEAESRRARADARRSGRAPATDAASDARRRREPGNLGSTERRPCGVEAEGPQRHPSRNRDRGVADAGGARFGQLAGRALAQETGSLAGHVVADHHRTRPVVDWGPYQPAITRWEAVTGRVAPRPTAPGRTGERLAPAFVEWLMGLAPGWVTDVPGLSRNAQLRALGNGVVPQQAALALRELLEDARRAGLALVA